VFVLRVAGREARVEHRVQLTLAPDVNATPAARAALGDVEFALDQVLFENLRLLVTELVTNSIRHADSPDHSEVELTVDVLPETVNVAVSDHGTGFQPARRSENSDPGSGWGLFLVEQLSDRWGVDGNGSTRVWFEIDR
jgi:anti-sigma regulatory factor (Ser/Thr protein kinase)